MISLSLVKKREKYLPTMCVQRASLFFVVGMGGVKGCFVSGW